MQLIKYQATRNVHRMILLPGKISRLPVSLLHLAQVLNQNSVKLIHTNIHTHTPSVCPSQQTQVSEDHLSLLPCPGEEAESRIVGSLGVSSLSSTHNTAKAQ